jgi:hypothetical protein
MIPPDLGKMFFKLLFHTTMEGSARLNSPNLSQNETQPFVYSPRPINTNDRTSSGQAAHQEVSSNNRYRLKRYLWRSFLTIAAPLVVLVFYAFICFHFLAHPLSNNVFPSSAVNAIWVYYCWFLISVFILDWARTGLANIEASALMTPYLAPSTARELMWHADANWANPLWWLRALRSLFWKLFTLIRHENTGPRSVPRPGALWMLLSLVHILLFVAVPLSGLSMEVTDAFRYSPKSALIHGPNETSFNGRMFIDISRRVRRNWVSGRKTSPSNGALLYAPHGTRKVTTTYFEDQATEAARNANGTTIRIFAGPAVREPIWGEAWGLSANISCIPTPLDQLQMIKSDAHTSAVNVCSTQNGCEFQWLEAAKIPPMNIYREPVLNVPLWLNESRSINLPIGLQAYSLLAAADGWSTMLLDHSSNATISPYNQVSNHDDWTFDHIVGGAPPENVTNSMFEVLLWQAGGSDVYGTTDDEAFKDLIRNPSGLVIIHNGTIDLLEMVDANYSGIFAGFGVHCDIKSAVGRAGLNPDDRTFFKFERGKAAPEAVFPFPVNMAPLQIQSVASLAANQKMGNINDGLAPHEESSGETTLAAAHRAIGSTVVPRADGKYGAYLYYPTLTTENLTLAMYKLLGESVISLMDEGGISPWTSPTIHTLTPARYLRPGAVPWRPVLTLLAIWAFSTSLSALYSLLFVGRRWAPTLSGFELFKFGAEYQDEVHQFVTVDLQGCNESLAAIPGMVGVLPGHGSADAEDLGFIGLSEVVADRRAEVKYTLDREMAQKDVHIRKAVLIS